MIFIKRMEVWNTISLIIISFALNVSWIIITPHNSVEFRDIKNFNPESFIDDLNSCDMFNDSACEKDISLDKSNLNFTEICNKNNPIKVARLKKRWNPWVTPDVVKLMYERDHVYTKAVKTKDGSLYNHYRSLRNHVTNVIQENNILSILPRIKAETLLISLMIFFIESPKTSLCV